MFYICRTAFRRFLWPGVHLGFGDFTLQCPSSILLWIRSGSLNGEIG